MKKINKIYIFGLIAIVACILGFASHTDTAKANPVEYDRVYMAKGGGQSTFNAVPTTTPGMTFLAAGATTTFSFSTAKAEMINLEFRTVASTSIANLSFTYETSNDTANCDVDPNLCNWSLPSLITSQVVASTTPTWTWRPDAPLNATSTLSFLINPTYSKYIRVKANFTGAAGAIWMSATRRTQNSSFGGN